MVSGALGAEGGGNGALYPSRPVFRPRAGRDRGRDAPMKLLVANLGSTSLKWRLFDFSNGWHDSANAIATVVIGQWTGSIDRAQLDRVLSGQDPFDETTMVDDGHGDAVPSAPEPVRCSA